MSGGKGGSTTQAVQIPKWVEEPATRNLARAEAAQQIGYMPYYGPDVAAFNPTQLAAMQSNIGAAQAFGLAPAGMTAAQGMPTPMQFADGTVGYSSGSLYDQALAELEARRPEQVAAYERLFVDPATGARAAYLPEPKPEPEYRWGASSEKDQKDMDAMLRDWRYAQEASNW